MGADVIALRSALAMLVDLKDGPRNDAYREAKEGAWQAARDALAACPPGSLAAREGDGLPEDVRKRARNAVRAWFPGEGAFAREAADAAAKIVWESACASLAAASQGGGGLADEDAALLADQITKYGLPEHAGLAGLLRHLEGNYALTHLADHGTIDRAVVDEFKVKFAHNLPAAAPPAETGGGERRLPGGVHHRLTNAIATDALDPRGRGGMVSVRADDLRVAVEVANAHAGGLDREAARAEVLAIVNDETAGEAPVAAERIADRVVDRLTGGGAP